MDGLLDKISSYNIFNYLLPGSIFAVVADALTSFRVLQEDIIVGLFLYYFIGLVISRIGSLIIEPIFKATRFISFVDYNKFVEASKVDSIISILSETNNMYRTFCALFVLLPSVVLFDRYVTALPFLINISLLIVSVVLLLLFSFAYRKQTTYINKRVSKVIEDSNAESI